MIALLQVANESFNAMTDADPDAIWVDSAWRFGAARDFWLGNNGSAMEAYLLRGTCAINYIDVPVFLAVFSEVDSLEQVPDCDAVRTSCVAEYCGRQGAGDGPP